MSFKSKVTPQVRPILVGQGDKNNAPFATGQEKDKKPVVKVAPNIR